MDDLKMVFYIVVAIIWVIYNNYKKITKAAQERNPAKPTPDVITENWPPVNFPRESPVIEKRQTVERQKVSHPRAKIVKEPLKGRDPIRKFSTVSRSSKSTSYRTAPEGGSIQPSKIVHFEDESFGFETPNLVLEEIRNTDMRRAVILSEVLKRPNF
jgi:hypothetical protein